MTCKLTGYVYDFSCEHCRTRFLQNEPCKYIRKIWHDIFENKGQSCEGWKDGSNCGCAKQCVRKRRVQEREVAENNERTPMRSMRGR